VVNGSFCLVIMLSCKGQVFFPLAHKPPAQPVHLLLFHPYQGLVFPTAHIQCVCVCVSSIDIQLFLHLYIPLASGSHIEISMFCPVLFDSNPSLDIVIFIHAHIRCTYTCMLNVGCPWTNRANRLYPSILYFSSEMVL